MKIALSIFFSILVFATSMSNLALAVFFKINQSQIAGTICINKFKPEKKCQGRCFFKNMFEENNNKANQNANCQDIVDNLKINLLPTPSNHFIEKKPGYKKKPVFRPDQFSLQFFSPTLLKPPIYNGPFI